MTTRSSFTDEEWAAIFQAPVMAGMVVMMTGKSGPIQIAQEMIAVGSALAEADRTTSSALVKAIAEAAKAGEKPAKIEQQPKTVEEAQAMATAHLRSITTLVDAKLPAGEAQEFKRWLVNVSEKVAQAAKEGGFLGFGGTQVTDEERAAMDTVAATLGVSRT